MRLSRLPTRQSVRIFTYRQASARPTLLVNDLLWRRSHRQTSRHHSTSSHPKDGSSVNAAEVSHFTNLAASWWDPHGPSRLLHLMNPLRHDFIKSCTSSTLEPSRHDLTYLDVGCGGGIFASSAARLATTSKVVAIDPTPDVIKVARDHQKNDPLLSQHGRLSYVNCAIEELDTHKEEIPPGGFDFVTVFEVIEHIDQPAAFLRQATAHLKPGGWLIGSTIARHPLSYFTTKIVAEAPWPVGVVPRGTHDWNKYINPTELRQWFEKENVLARDAEQSKPYGAIRIEGCAYLPVVGWRFIPRLAEVGNYFFGIQKLAKPGQTEQSEGS